MKKIITVTLCIVLVLLFAGCGKNGDTSKVEIDYGASSVLKSFIHSMLSALLHSSSGI